MEFRLIDFVRINSFLYDKTSSQYKCRITKLAKWKELSDELGVGVVELQKRWKTLRDRYWREDKKYTQTAAQIRWKYYKALSFLKGFCDDDTKTVFFSNEGCETQVGEEAYQQFITDNKECLETQESRIPLTNSNEYTGTVQVQVNNNRPTRAPKRKRATNQNKRKMLQEMDALLDQAKINFQATSMIQTFFFSMAIQVEQANLPFDRIAYLQQEILKMVNDQIKENMQEQNANNVDYTNLV